MGNIPIVSLADIAVELHLAQASLTDVAFSVAVHSMISCDEAGRLEKLSARLGIRSPIPSRVIADKEYHAAMIGQAFEIIKALIPYEDEVREMVARRPATFPKLTVVPA